jgi:hypothetical protein
MKYRAISITSAFLVIMIASVQAALLDSLHTNQYTNMYFNSPSGGQLRYSIYLPNGFTASEHLPYFMSMHGVGPPPDFAPMYLGSNPKFDINVKQRCVLVEPFCPLDQTCWDNKGYSTGNHLLDPNPTNGIRMVLELVPYIQRELGLDVNRCYVVGASNGGYATWDLILRKSYLFAAAIPICGSGDRSKADRLVSMPIWAHHGSADDVVPISGSRDMIKAIRILGGDPRYTEYPVAHEAWVPAWADDSLMPWLFRQSRVPDSTSPPTPAGFTATPMTGGDRVLLQWRSVTDPESKSVAYHIYRNGRWRASLKDTAMVDSGLVAQTSYGYQVAAYNPCDRVSAKSDSLVVQTLADTKAPGIEWVRSVALTNVRIRFNEAVSAASAQNAANYQADKGVTIAKAALKDSITVLLTTSAQTPNTAYTLTIRNIADRSPASNAISATGISAAYTCLSTGRAFDEIWLSVTGSTVADLTGSAAFQGAPSRIDTLPALEANAVWQLNFGERIRGYIYPPATGTYTFWAAGDDVFQLFISPDADPAHKQLVGWILTAVPSREFDYCHTQRSPPYQMTKDTRYYIEILQKQSTGTDNCAIAWKRADGLTREIVPADCFIPYPEPAPPQTGTADRLEMHGRRLVSVRVNRTGGMEITVRSQGPHTIAFFDCKGALRASFSGMGKKSYSIPPLPAGIYSMRIASDGKTRVQSVLVGK